MKRSTKTWVITATALVLIGIVVFGIVLAANHWDLAALDNTKYTTETVDITEEFDSISINSDTEDIVFVKSVDGKCRAVFYEQEKIVHTAEVQNGTLLIGKNDTRKWYERINMLSFSGTPRITVCLPETEYASLVIDESTGDIEIPEDLTFDSVDISVSTGHVDCRASSSGLLRIKADTGDIYLEGLSAGELELSVSTGRVEARSVACEGNIGVSVSTGKASLTDISCRSVASSGSTGDITLKNVAASDSFSIERSTGDVRLEDSDADQITVKTSTGDVTGTLRSDKIFNANTSTGSVRVPDTATGGICNITTDTGDIDIMVINRQ